MSNIGLLTELREDLDAYLSDSVFGPAHMSVDWRAVFKEKIAKIDAALSKAKGHNTSDGEG